MSIIRLCIITTMLAVTFVGLAALHEDEVRASANSGHSGVQCCAVEPLAGGQPSGVMRVADHLDSTLLGETEICSQTSGCRAKL